MIRWHLLEDERPSVVQQISRLTKDWKGWIKASQKMSAFDWWTWRHLFLGCSSRNSRKHEKSTLLISLRTNTSHPLLAFEILSAKKKQEQKAWLLWSLSHLLSFQWCAFFHYIKCCKSWVNNVRTTQWSLTLKTSQQLEVTYFSYFRNQLLTWRWVFLSCLLFVF